MRQGLGDVFADGFPGVLKEFGEAAHFFSPTLVNGMHPYAGPGSAITWDLFSSIELRQILDPRGVGLGQKVRHPH